LLWPESDDDGARGALRRTLSVLNAGLGPGVLAIDRSAVDLDAAAADVDVERFRRALAAARAHRHPPDAPCDVCRGALERAVALDRGGFMDGFIVRDSEPFDEWLLAEREAHDRELAGALERLALERQAAGAWAEAIAAGRRWLELDPLHEPAHRLLMRAHASAGETAAAVRQFRDCVRTLDRELGVTPLPETTELYEAIRDGVRIAPSAAVPGGPIDVQRRGRPPLVGRERELEAALGALEGIGEDGVVLTVEGEPGVGKTRFADAIAEAVRERGGRVVVASAYAGESTLAFGPVVSLIRSGLADGGHPTLPPEVANELVRIVPALGPAGADTIFTDGPAARHRLLDAIATGLTVIVAGPRPGLVVLEDLHWADESTLDAFGFLARRLVGRPLGMVVTFRREDVDEHTAGLVAGLTALAGSTALRLDRLDGPASRELATAAWSSSVPPDDETLDDLVREADGLPLYLVEAATLGDVGATPPGVRALLIGRLATLSELARQIAAAGAILGGDFDLETVRATSGRSEDETLVALEELIARGLVREFRVGSLAGYDFRHPSQREVVEDSLSLARRRLLHRRAAAALRTSSRWPGHDPLHARLARVARHEREAGRDLQAAEAFREAGELARAVFANREALIHHESALALGHPDELGLQMAIGELRTRTGDYRGAIEAFEAAAASAGLEQLPAIEHRLGQVHLRRGDLPAGASHLDASLAALAALGAAGPPVTRARTLVDRAIAAHRLGDAAGAADRAAEAADLATRSGDPTAIADAERVRGLLARAAGDTSTAKAAIVASLKAARAADDRPAVVAARNALALVLGDAGETTAAVDEAEAALALAQQIGDRHLEAAVGNNLADILHAAGRVDESMGRLKDAVAAFADVSARGEGEAGPLEPGIWMLESW
jgi:DNA-binding SARP family transcriptional activator